jgi:tetratricopeptide (TPR) repeat protein
MPYSGHFSITMLHQIGMLEKTLLQIIDGAFDTAALQNEIEQKAETSAHFLMNKARALPFHAKKQRLALLHKAIELGQAEPEFELYLGETLVSYGRWTEAKQIYDRGWKKNPNSNLGLLSYLGYLNLSRRYDESRIVFEKLAELSPGFVNAINLTRQKFDCYPYGRSRWLRTLRSVRGFLSALSIR